MGRIRFRSLNDPDETVTFPRGQSQLVRMAGMAVGRDTHHPGWHWTEHVKPIVQTEWCEFHHRGVVLQGRMGVRMSDGEEAVIGPHNVFDIPSGHTGWVEGDEELVTLDWAGVEGWAKSLSADRVVATILFTDVVGSTKLATRHGDAAWRRMLALHNDTVRSLLATFRGLEVKTAGDSFLATFDGAARAVRCGRAMIEALAAIEIPIRVGIHTGEVRVTPDDVTGVAVHIAARVMAVADVGQVLVSHTTRELTEGSDLAFRSVGGRSLKGIEGTRELFALET